MYETLLSIIGTAFIGCLGWAYTISGRVSQNEQKYDGLHELLEARFDEINRRLSRIEIAMNGALKPHKHED